MTAAYAALANDGIYSNSRTYVKVCDSKGHILLSNEERSEVILSHSTALIMTKILTEVADPSGYGTARKLTVTENIDVAAKTGTTNDNKDLYFAGYTPYFVGAVWFGYDQPRFMQPFSISPALTLWDEVMNRIHAKYIEREKNGEGEVKSFDFSELVERTYCKDSGLLVGEYCHLDPRHNRTATGYYTRDTVPKTECDVHVPVRWCTETRSVAGDGCPEESCVKIALVRNEDRRIEKKVNVLDAQYTYMTVPYDYQYPDDPSLPYFINLYINGTYPGFTSGVSRPVNSWCVEHNPEGLVSWEALCEQYRLEHPEEFEDEEEKEEDEGEDET
jgi:penicillin-binding protein 1A